MLLVPAIMLAVFTIGSFTIDRIEPVVTTKEQVEPDKTRGI